MSLLSWIVFTPWIGALLVFLLRCKLSPRLGRLLPIVFSLSTLALGLLALTRFDPAVTGLQFVEKQPWIRALNVRYHLGLDGLSLVLVLLTGLLAPLALYGTTRNARCPAIHGALFLLLQGSALGVFLALDFFPWFIFWELSLVPAFFLIKLWGAQPTSS
jgi:NADH-quinone oxidoreductase subunit M